MFFWGTDQCDTSMVDGLLSLINVSGGFRPLQSALAVQLDAMNCAPTGMKHENRKIQISYVKTGTNRPKGTAGNSIFVMISRHFRADDCTDAGGRATLDAKAEGGRLCGINERLSTKITKGAHEKWISGCALKIASAARLVSYYRFVKFKIHAEHL
ncbi:MAG: hypothetical protein RL497_1136 [Pseudomonadota bacterium]|jgi:hypothetical protein